MYICADCGCVYSDKVTHTEIWGERITGCPSCGGYSEEAVQCDSCGRWIPENDEYPVCSKCMQEALDKLAEFLESTFTVGELKAINTWLEGEALNEPRSWRRV